MRPYRSLLLFFIVSFLFLLPGKIYSQPVIDMGGYLQTWYIYQQEDHLYPSLESVPDSFFRNSLETSDFRLRRARLNLKGSFNDTWSVNTWVEFATNNPLLLDFYIDAKISKALTIRGGQIMMPGQSYDTSRLASSKMPFFQRSSLTTKTSILMGYNAFRDIGLTAFGQVGKLWYGVQVSSGLGRIRQASPSFFQRDFGSGLFGGRLDFEIIDGFEVGGHFSANHQKNLIQGKNDPIDIDKSSWSLRLAVRDRLWKGLFAQTEYIHYTSGPDSWENFTENQNKYRLSGFYTDLGFRINKKWQVVSRYNEMTESNDTSITLKDESLSNQYTFGLTRFVHSEQNEFAKIHLNYLFGESGPMHLETAILVLVFQIKFLP